MRASIRFLLIGWIVGTAAYAELAVIVHPLRETELSREQLAQIYMKRRRFWSDGAPIFPLNREAQSEERRVFTDAVFGAQATRLDAYWDRNYFQGILPPATLASDEAIRRFVASDRNALGYVHVDAVNASVRVVLRLP